MEHTKLGGVANPQFTFEQTQFTPDSFWDRRRRIVRCNTLEAQLDMLKRTGRYDAFDLKWHPVYDQTPSFWPAPNHLFWDSDVAKWIEGACYFLRERENEQTAKVVEDLVKKISKAQQDDGYLNIHYTVVEPGKRFTNLRDMHELYNAGHLIEASLIYEEVFKNGQLINPITKYIQFLNRTFGPDAGQIHGYPGHPEIELSLLRFWRKTGVQEAFQLAKYFLEERGNPTGVDGRHYYDVEAEKRGDRRNEMPDAYPQRRSYWYQQAHKPILEQDTVEGHSVRAMYLLTAVADLCTIQPESFGNDYLPVLQKLWDNMVNKKMYLTGGIGAIKQWEGFGIDYFLPQSSEEGGCYAETCASIGVIMLAERLLQLDLNGEFADIMELCLYNAVLTGMSIDGKAFTYDNPLGSSEESISERQEWFEISCCPPNVTRLFGYLGGCLWTQKQTDPGKLDVNVHLYTSATLHGEVNGKPFELRQESNWPWDGDVKFELQGADDVEKTVRLRIPAWAESFEVSPAPESYALTKGYLALSPEYLRTHRSFQFQVGIKPRLLRPHPYTNQPIVAVARGPIVYCVEDVDNTWVKDQFKSVVFDTTAPLLETVAEDLTYDVNNEKKTEPYIAIVAERAARFLNIEGIHGYGQSASIALEKDHRETLRFVPYFARANRGGRGMMRVGLRVGDYQEA